MSFEDKRNVLRTGPPELLGETEITPEMVETLGKMGKFSDPRKPVYLANVLQGRLDRILLALIVAELLHTLRYVVLRGEIVAEPFLFVGLIAVVRRILIITAELERTGGQALSGRALTNQLLELGLLGLLTLTLAIAIYLVRRSGESSGSDLTTTITPGSTTAGI